MLGIWKYFFTRKIVVEKRNATSILFNFWCFVSDDQKDVKDNTVYLKVKIIISIIFYYAGNRSFSFYELITS